MSNRYLIFQVLSFIDRIKDSFFDCHHENLISEINQNSKLISSNSKCLIFKTYRLFYYCSKINEYLISLKMSKCIVDFFEIIDIDNNKGIIFILERIQIFFIVESCQIINILFEK